MDCESRNERRFSWTRTTGWVIKVERYRRDAGVINERNVLRRQC